MDETDVILSMLVSIKVLVGKNDLRDYRGARIKCIVVITIKCVSVDGRYLNLMIIWLALFIENNIILYRLFSYTSHKL
jgi:hypothetical protein